MSKHFFKLSAKWNDVSQQSFSQLKNNFVSSIVPSVMEKYNLTGISSADSISTILQWFYSDPVPQGETQGLLSEIIDFYTDVMFRVPHSRQLLYLANQSDPLYPVYVYEFEQGEDILYKQFNFSGAGHGSELFYIFGNPLLKKTSKLRFTPSEERLSLTMIRMWIEFIRKGVLSPSPYGYGPSWKKYSLKEDNYVIFRSDNNLPPAQPVVRSPPAPSTFGNVFRMWTELLPKLKELEVDQASRNQVPKGMTLTKDQPYRSAMYTLIGFVIVLLCLLVVCVILLKRHANEREAELF